MIKIKNGVVILPTSVVSCLKHPFPLPFSPKFPLLSHSITIDILLSNHLDFITLLAGKTIFTVANSGHSKSLHGQGGNCSDVETVVALIPSHRNGCDSTKVVCIAWDWWDGTDNKVDMGFGR